MVHGTVVPWHHGNIVTWHRGTMVPWYRGLMVPCQGQGQGQGQGLRASAKRHGQEPGAKARPMVKDQGWAKGQDQAKVQAWAKGHGQGQGSGLGQAKGQRQGVLYFPMDFVILDSCVLCPCSLDKSDTVNGKAFAIDF